MDSIYFRLLMAASLEIKKSRPSAVPIAITGDTAGSGIRDAELHVG
jgi:hypothetical protein